MTHRHRDHAHRISALDAINSSLQPIGRAPGLRAEVDRLVELKDVGALIALYDGFVASALAFMSIENQPRSGGTQKFLEEERAVAMSKAFFIADALKTLRPDEHDNIETFAATMFNCALAMGGTLDQATEIVNAINEQGYLRPAVQS